jgi:YggT family protein
LQLYSLIQVVNIIFEVLIWLIIIRCFLSFIPHNHYQPLIKFIYEMTEPIMAPFRRMIPAAGGIDFSPIIVVLAVSLLQRVVIRLLSSLF